KKANEEAAANKAAEAATPAIKPSVKGSTTGKTATTKKAPESILLNAENLALNDNFVKNRGVLPWPVDKGLVIMHYGRNQLPSGNSWIDVTGITVSSDIGSNVKAVFDGVVSNVVFIEDMQVVIIQHGKYFSTYSNLNNVSVQRGQNIKTGQVIGKVAANLDGIGAIDFFINDERGNLDPERWLKR
ncbi:MAG TPA: peptidoglycan DD-metalloendopeptidase family protein, partial [Ferruginibacter sp.]|nr:peptidoglycan DD-metalloendopeptidase family protein [Ferruginibacter sp.]